MDQLNKLVRKIITETSISQGTYYPLNTKQTELPPQIVDEILIVIEEYSLVISNKIRLDPESKNIKAFVDKKIKAIIQSKKEVKINTFDNSWLSIDLRDKAYVGTEAMSLHGPNNLCVVWN